MQAMSTPSEVLNVAMTLSSEQRSEVAYQLLLSLEPSGADEGVDQAWAEEIQRRRQAIRTGQMPLRDWDEALAAARQSIVAKGTT